jgi:outer membrane protein assembly factor BamC
MKKLFWVVLVSTMAGCSFLTQHDRRVEYKTAKPTNSLELPPDLSANIDDELKIPGTKPTLSDQKTITPSPSATQKVVTSQVLPKANDIKVLRNGEKRWLQVAGQQPEQLWTKVRNFWTDSGFTLKKEDMQTAVLETEWNENRGDIPQDVVRRTLGKVLDFLWQGSTRDKFRTRLERSEQNTEIFLTHRGAEEVSQGESFVWQSRPSDPELEAEMLQRLMIYLGETPEQAKTTIATAPTSKQPRAGLYENSLLINEEFPLAWRSVGLAIDKAGINIEDRNRTNGLYYVKYVPSELKMEKKGWLESLWNGEETPPQDLQIRVSEVVSTQCQVDVFDKDGKPSKLAPQINKLLLNHLK